MAGPDITWRFVLCNLYGSPIAILDPYMQNTSLTFQLNRPAQLTFDVPSDVPAVTGSLDNTGFNSISGDNFPNLSVKGGRMIRGYRKVGTAPGNWILKYVGRVWTVEDSGDGTSVRTSVTCYDALYELSKRMIRNAAGVFDSKTGAVSIRFWGSPAGSSTYSTVIKAMIDRTNTYGLKPTTIVTTGTWGTTAPCSVTYSAQYILPEIITLTDTGLIDLDVTYIDTTPSPGNLATQMQLGASAEAGSDNPAIIFGYAGPPRSTSALTRTESLDTFANDITLRGKSPKGKGVRHYSKNSVAVHGAFEDYQSINVLSKRLLADLVTEQLALRATPRELVNVLPMPELAPPPWTDEPGSSLIDTWYLGDRVQVVIGSPADIAARRNVSGIQRIYGFTIAMDDTFAEHITNMVFSADAETTV